MSEAKIPVLCRKLSLPPEYAPLIREALTHRTYAVEHGLKYDNQRLEFLGDAVLEIILTEHLYFLYPELSEGDLTKVRSALSCESTLAEIARDLTLGEYLLIGNGEKECAGNRRESTLCDLFEAVLGAVYIGGNLEKARKFVLDILNVKYPDPAKLLISLNPKGQLQEFAQGKWKLVPSYRLFRSGGPKHCPFYEVEVTVSSFTAVGSGTSRKLAEIDAAGRLWLYLHNRYGRKH